MAKKKSKLDKIIKSVEDFISPKKKVVKKTGKELILESLQKKSDEVMTKK